VFICDPNKIGILGTRFECLAKVKVRQSLRLTTRSFPPTGKMKRLLVSMYFLVNGNGLGWLTQRSNYQTPWYLSSFSHPPCLSVSNSTTTESAAVYSVCSNKSLMGWDVLVGNIAQCLMSPNLKCDLLWFLWKAETAGWVGWKNLLLFACQHASTSSFFVLRLFNRQHEHSPW
jgi:hypothetical protein